MARRGLGVKDEQETPESVQEIEDVELLEMYGKHIASREILTGDETMKTLNGDTMNWASDYISVKVETDEIASSYRVGQEVWYAGKARKVDSVSGQFVFVSASPEELG